MHHPKDRIAHTSRGAQAGTRNSSMGSRWPSFSAVLNLAVSFQENTHIQTCFIKHVLISCLCLFCYLTVGFECRIIQFNQLQL